MPKEVGYTAGFAAMTGAMVLAALAGLLIPSARRPARSAEPLSVAGASAGEAVAATE